MLQKTDAIVLNSLKYGDSGLIVHCFTKDYGLKSYYINGILNNKKNKFKRSFFQPMNQLEIVGFHNNKGQLNSIKDLTLRYHFQEIHTDIIKQTITLFLSEILTHTLREEFIDAKLFDFLENSFKWLDQQEKTTNFHLSFLVQLIRQLGFFPIMEGKSEYFDMVEGKFLNHPLSQIYIKEPELTNFIKVMKSDYNSILALEIKAHQRAELLERILQYMSLHIPSFKKPKSMVVLQELFH
jgi:DNA repair protein RecO (recombination protein O)